MRTLSDAFESEEVSLPNEAAVVAGSAFEYESKSNLHYWKYKHCLHDSTMIARVPFAVIPIIGDAVLVSHGTCCPRNSIRRS